MNQNVKDALSFDPLDTAEKITGLRCDEDQNTIGVGVALSTFNSDVKKSILVETKDTHFMMLFSEFLSVATDLGFKEILRDQIQDSKDVFIIMYRPGILLKCESYYDGSVVNSANMYLNYKGPNEGMFHYSGGYVCDADGQSVWEASFDVREGLRFTINMMEEKGQILESWVERPFLWLLDYNHTKIEGYDYNAINAGRISRLPSEVQRMILQAKYK